MNTNRAIDVDDVKSKCAELHNIFNKMERHHFPFSKSIPTNGIYILFEKGEMAHEGDRIVRIGTHTGEGQLASRLKQHFIVENKDRSIFRKNIGRAFLNGKQDPFLEQWDWDLTTRAAKEKYSHLVDKDKKDFIEQKVSDYIQSNLSFVIFEVETKEERLHLESRIISTVSSCPSCSPSQNWLGLYSPKEKIQASGLWLVNELYKTALDEADMNRIKALVHVANKALKADS